ncbi:MAG: DUF1016 N-terminal domain-containing protein [Cyclobacteriaceae bacterium]|nr:DUF1016 N-terminal domain-containing protein [Cyclobacteriaceae bacterium]
MNFSLLASTIHQAHSTLQQSALKSVNKHLTIRNWLVGFYIVEFEQNGEDRAKYGNKLLPELAKSINIRGLSETSLKLNRQFFQIYLQIRQVLTDEFQNNENQLLTTLQTPSAPSQKSTIGNLLPPDKLISRLSFSHFTLLLPIADSLKRIFYEIECVRGNWSHKELRRQITTLYFERSDMSDNPPVGLLLITNNKPLVEYAMADADQHLFVSKYVLALPSTKQLEEFIRKELNN